MRKILNNFLKRYFGVIEYVLTLVNVDGEAKIITYGTIKKLDEIVFEINSEKYWFVQKIEKIRRYNFTYSKEVIHAPLWFTAKDVTEKENIDNYEYSYLIKDNSLKNIKRVS